MISIVMGALLCVAPEDPATLASVDTVKQEFEAAQAAFFEKYSQTPEGEREALLRTERPSPDDYVDQMLDIADEHEGEAAERDALIWVIQNSRSAETRNRSINILADGHAADAAIEPVLYAMPFYPDPTSMRFIRTVLDENSHPNVKGIATYTLAKMTWQTEPDEARTLIDRVADEFADVDYRGKSLGETVERDLFEIENLAIGKVAPDIAGEDIDGVEFNLSDYRGKVVVLDFWGDW